MNEIYRLLFELIRVSIGASGCLSKTPTNEEWKALYDMAKKQSLVGVCFAGVQKLVLQEQAPEEMLYLTWMGMAAKIQQRNEVVNRQCVDLQDKLVKDDFRSCILKGQGNAENYGSLTMLRQSGDIDIFIEGGFEKVNAYVQRIAPTNKIDVQHIQFEIFEGTEVEAHYIPFVLNSPIQNRVLRRFFKDQEERMLNNKIRLSDGSEIVGAHNEFNLVFMLAHIYQHLFTEGVGLRQLMDYFFVLKHEKVVQEVSEVSKVQDVIAELGLSRFASALMWVIKTVFVGHDDDNDNIFPWKPKEKDGKFLLEEIMKSGNFGKQDERQKGLYDSKWNSFWMVHFKTFRMWRFDHWAWFWSPLMRMKWKLWQLRNNYK